MLVLRADLHRWKLRARRTRSILLIAGRPQRCTHVLLRQTQEPQRRGDKMPGAKKRGGELNARRPFSFTPSWPDAHEKREASGSAIRCRLRRRCRVSLGSISVVRSGIKLDSGLDVGDQRLGQLLA